MPSCRGLLPCRRLLSPFHPVTCKPFLRAQLQIHLSASSTVQDAVLACRVPACASSLAGLQRASLPTSPVSSVRAGATFSFPRSLPSSVWNLRGLVSVYWTRVKAPHRPAAAAFALSDEGGVNGSHIGEKPSLFPWTERGLAIADKAASYPLVFVCGRIAINWVPGGAAVLPFRSRQRCLFINTDRGTCYRPSAGLRQAALSPHPRRGSDPSDSWGHSGRPRPSVGAGDSGWGAPRAEGHRHEE